MYLKFPYVRPLGVALAFLSPLFAGGAVLESWTFGPPLGRTLHEVAPDGPGSGGPTRNFDVAIPGVSTTSLGLRLRNTGIGGFGTRTAFADFGAPVSGGNLELQVELAAWNWSQDAEGSPQLRLEMIRGNDFVVAGIDLQRLEGAVRVSPILDARGNGATGGGSHDLALASTATALGIAVDLAAGTFRFGVRAADESTFTLVDSGSLDDTGGPVHSLRFAMEGDFTLGGLQAAYMDLSGIQVTSGEMLFAEEVAGFAAWAAGFGLEGAAASPTGTAFGDGIPLLLKYALGLDPTVPASRATLPLASFSEEGLRFSFSRADVDDLVYIVEASTDLNVWEGVWTSADGSPFDPSPEVLVPLPADESATFLRLRVELIE